ACNTKVEHTNLRYMPQSHIYLRGIRWNGKFCPRDRYSDQQPHREASCQKEKNAWPTAMHGSEARSIRACRKVKKRWQKYKGRLQRLVVRLARPDTDGLFHWQDEDLAVTDISGVSCLSDDLHHLILFIIGDDQFHLH